MILKDSEKEVGESNGTGEKNEEQIEFNYKNISILPRKDELLNKCRYYDVPENLIRRKYDSVDHYKDTQFKLLRENYVDQFKNSIEYFKKRLEEEDGNVQNVHSTSSLYIYHGLKMKSFRLTETAIIYKFGFNFGLLSHIDWEETNRKLTGSLLAFSDDNFETCIFGLVDGFCKEDEIGISFDIDNEINFRKIFTSKNLIAIESISYFNSCYHSLKILQETNVIPFEKYVVDLDMSNNHLKKETAGEITSNFSNLNLNGEKRNGFSFDSNSNPSDLFSFDESQKESFESALDKEFVIIQGPPGTGKTYTGLRIIQTLLDKKKGSEEITPPIIILAYKNFALDNLLEGVLQFTQNIIRIGGGSKSQKLKDKSLLNLLKKQPKTNYYLQVPGMREVKNNFCIFKKNVAELKMLELGFFPFSDKFFSVIGQNFKYLLSKFEDPLNVSVYECLYAKKIIKFLEIEDCNKFLMGRKHFLKILLSKIKTSDETDDKNYKLLEREKITINNDKYLNGNIRVSNNVLLNRVKEEMSERVIKWKINGSEEEEDEDDFQILIGDENIVSNHINNINVHTFFDKFVQNDNEEFFAISRNLEDKILLVYQDTIDEIKERMKKIGKNSRRNNKFFQVEYFIQIMDKLKFQNDDEIYTKEELYDLSKDPDFRLDSLESSDRVKVYKSWVNSHMNNLTYEIKNYNECSKFICKNLKKERVHERYNICMYADVIGLTITGSTIYRDLIAALKPEIVLIEEAAEVLESHLISSLPEHVKHLIMIGDHQQLRPIISCNLLTNKKYDISLFERMVMNKIEFTQLKYQHRMRLNISNLIKGTIYKELYDHESVFNYSGTLKQLCSTLFFFKVLSEEKFKNETYSNDEEAILILEFVHYLIKHGIPPNSITVLTAYNGQLDNMRKKVNFIYDTKLSYLDVNSKNDKVPEEVVKNSFFLNSIDSYQGQENDIIIISFVRSNEQGSIGFLRTPNRINVAISRAKKALFCFGNFDLFQRQSKLWRNIIDKIKYEPSYYGDCMELRCNYTKKITEVRNSRDLKILNNKCHSGSNKFKYKKIIEL